jgi:iron complex transport system ATP-binding protein
MDNAKHVIELNGLAVGYDGQSLLSGVNASAGPGDFILLFGANGMGKSTLLKSLSGQLKPLEGEVSVLGAKISNMELKELAKKVAFNPGNLVLPLEVSVMDLLQFARIPYLGGVQQLSEADSNVIDEVVKELELHSLLDAAYMSLSDGQKQLVNIARSLVQETDIVLLDEPTAHLDLVNKKRIFELLQELAQKGKVVISTTHDLHEGFSFGNQFWVITKERQFKAFSASSGVSLDNIKELIF